VDYCWSPVIGQALLSVFWNIVSYFIPYPVDGFAILVRVSGYRCFDILQWSISLDSVFKALSTNKIDYLVLDFVQIHKHIKSCVRLIWNYSNNYNMLPFYYDLT
jgi:hypothetical protein